MDPILSPLPANRHLAWPHCFNARDLGGLPIEGGGTTRWRVLVRSDLLSRLTPVGRQALLDYSIRTIIDLRRPEEVQAEPSPFTQASGAVPVRYLNIPLESPDSHVDSLMERASSQAEVYCISLEHHQANLAQVLRAILHARSGVLVHCHAGKDRTGIVSALLLAVAGVPRSEIARDYAISQARLWPLYEKLVEEAGGEDQVNPWLKPIATEGTMQTVLAHLDTRYGGVGPYLSAIGLTLDEIERLKLLR